MHDDALAGLLRLTVRLAAELAHRDLTYLGLGPGQARLLEEALRHPGLTGDDFHKRLKLTRATVSVALKTLIRASYLRTRPHPRDGRCRIHFPTGLGATVAREFAAVRRDHDEVLLHGIPAGDRDLLRRRLLDMVTNLTQEMRHPGRPCAIFPGDRPVAPGINEGHAP